MEDKGILESNFIAVEYEGEVWLRVKMPYIREWIVQIRKVPGRKWDGVKKCWMIPADEEIVLILCSVLKEIPVKISDSKLYKKFPLFSTLCGPEDHHAIQLLNQLLLRKGYSMKTRKAYRGHAERFLRQSIVSVNEVSREHLNKYLLELIETGRSNSYKNIRFAQKVTKHFLPCYLNKKYYPCLNRSPILNTDYCSPWPTPPVFG